MQNFCQFEVDFHVINKARTFESRIPVEALPTLIDFSENWSIKYSSSYVLTTCRLIKAPGLYWEHKM